MSIARRLAKCSSVSLLICGAEQAARAAVVDAALAGCTRLPHTRHFAACGSWHVSRPCAGHAADDLGITSPARRNDRLNVAHACAFAAQFERCAAWRWSPSRRRRTRAAPTATGVSCCGAPTCVDRLHRGDLPCAGYLGHCPALAGDEAQAPVEPVDLADHAVDVERRIVLRNPTPSWKSINSEAPRDHWSDRAPQDRTPPAPPSVALPPGRLRPGVTSLQAVGRKAQRFGQPAVELACT